MANPEAKNLNGQLYRHFDEAGMLHLEEYDFKGNLLKKNRQVLSDSIIVNALDGPVDPNAAIGPWAAPAFRADWHDISPTVLDALLSGEDYITESRYDALNRVLEITCPEDIFGEAAKIKLDYNRAGALEGVKLENPVTQQDEVFCRAHCL